MLRFSHEENCWQMLDYTCNEWNNIDPAFARKMFDCGYRVKLS